MTKSKTLIWWIDDEPDRLKKIARQRIEEAGKAELVSHSLTSQEEQTNLECALIYAQKAGTQPHLIVIDQFLKVQAGVRPSFKGSSCAVAFREVAPSIPVVGVTAVETGKVAELQKDQFIELFSLDDLQSGRRVSDLFAITDGFARIVRESSDFSDKLKSSNTILKWLNCPKSDHEFLTACLPGEFLTPWDDETPHAFSRWVWHIFIGRAGFLYDDLEIATLLGLKESGLKYLLKDLKSCQFDGVFASNSRRRWWLSKVRDRVRSFKGCQAIEPLSHLGRARLGVRKKAHFSESYGANNKKDIPNTVAFGDDTRALRIQAMVNNTEVISTDTPPVGFEALRVFRQT